MFFKKQLDQLVGISLQQGSLTLCIIPPQIGDHSAVADSTKKTIFKKEQVNSFDFASVMGGIHNEYDLTCRCHLVLNSTQSQIVQVDKPNIPAAEMLAALKWQVKDLVSIAPENMVLDYFDSPLLIGGVEKINVVCSPLNELQKMVAVLNSTRSTIASITIEEFAFANLLPVQNDACLLVCQQPNEDVILLIIKQGKLYFYRRLHGFSDIESKTEDELTMTFVDRLALEIQRSSDYFERQLKQAPIKDIKVLLPIQLESFFARKLAENSHVPVSLLALPDAYQAYRQYACAIGATMQTYVADKQRERVDGR